MSGHPLDADDMGLSDALGRLEAVMEELRPLGISGVAFLIADDPLSGDALNGAYWNCGKTMALGLIEVGKVKIMRELLDGE